MKNQSKAKLIYIYPVLLIVLAILVNGCDFLVGLHDPLDYSHYYYEIVVPSHKINALYINPELRDSIHPDFTGQSNAEMFYWTLLTKLILIQL